MFGNKEAELLQRLKEQQEAEQLEKMDAVPEAFAGMQEDIDSIMPTTPMEEQLALNEIQQAQEASETVEDVADVGRSIASAESEPVKSEKKIEDTNKQAKSPYMKSKEEMDPRAEYAKLIEEYKKRLAEPDKELGWKDHLPDALAAAHNIMNYSQGNIMPNIKLGSVDKAKKSIASKKKGDLTGLKSLQQMHQAYQKMGKKDKKVKDIYKVGDDLVKYDSETGKAKSVLDKVGKDLSFKEKETIKSDIKQKEATMKSNIKTRKQAESSIKDLDEQLHKVKRAKKLLKELKEKSTFSDTGPIDQYTSSFTSRGQKLRQAFNDLSLDKMAKLFKGMSKAVDSDAERKMFEQSQASLSNFPDVNMEILQQMENNINSLKNKNSNLMNSFNKDGDEVQVEESTGPYGQTVERNGKKYMWNPSAKKYQLM